MPPAAPAASDGFPSSVLDLAELGTLFETHWPRLVGVARRRINPSLGVRVDAEGVVGAAFLDARRRWPDYRADPKVPPFVWLYRLVVDRVVEEWRAATRECRDLHLEAAWPSEPSVALGLRLADHGDGPATEAVRAEVKARVRAALAELPRDDREVIELRNFEGLPFAEIGALMHLAENTVTVRYARALRKLRDVWRLTGESRP